ncbi:hypothetical protein [Billgrantia endophytica]|uniref:Uncharacterized protein n=1 Tax=Billgrantia endophytica TaxID=2033802 RepID=A0A2N7U0C1_9GAMM|nr:hypothetical protein [Halomonas endophytica]PMR73863.1 hypothetical protein C1H69_16190 [Halomonas endophytica]
MAKKPWIPVAAVLALALGLVGCGDAEEDAGVTETEEVGTPAGEATDDMATEEDETLQEEAPAPLPAEDDTAEASEEDGVGLPPDDDIDTDVETLGESPTATLEEGGALPGEPTRSDIDAILEDTERRFEEAQRQIDEQYEEAEQDPPVFEPMEDPTSLEPMEDDERGATSTINDGDALPGETTQSDIDALLEETERRFEEARRQLDEQFEEAERRDPQSEAPRFDIED